MFIAALIYIALVFVVFAVDDDWPAPMTISVLVGGGFAVYAVSHLVVLVRARRATPPAR